ncbi:MAG: AAA family ATPase [Chloroflexi bacterium]|nr:AAA family ATPase [Chloroflexota bacterium]
MLTKLTIRNFKRFEHAEIDLGRAVVFIGPNNSGKTTALQALALWDIGVRRWNEKRADSSAEKRSGVAINRKDIFAVALPNAKLLWRSLKAHTSEKRTKDGKDIRATKDIYIDAIVEGVTDGQAWECGLEFDYANEESIYCRPLRTGNGSDKPPRMPVPPQVSGIKVAFLPPMSGLADREFSKQPGEINYLIGQGQTAQVLRNLCYRLSNDEARPERWRSVVEQMRRLFVVQVLPPVLTENDEIVMSYRDERGIELDLSCSGRGLQQTLLLLCHLYANPGTVLLLDEPDAHLEILRQQEVYSILTEVAEAQGSQVIAASHSEKILEAAGDRDVVVAFIYDTIKRLDDRGIPAQKHLLKSLKEIGFADFYQAELRRWVLYLEGSTDLAILRAFADRLGHAAARAALDAPFHVAVGNDLARACGHFDTLRSARPGLRGIALLDRRDDPPGTPAGLAAHFWKRREIENYLDAPRTLLAYARGSPGDNLFDQRDAAGRERIMDELIRGRTPPDALANADDPFWLRTKISDEYLDVIFAEFFKRLALPNLLRKTDYHTLARFVNAAAIDPEVRQNLDLIAQVAAAAQPTSATP